MADFSFLVAMFVCMFFLCFLPPPLFIIIHVFIPGILCIKSIVTIMILNYAHIN